MVVHFEREMAANRVDARDLMRLIDEVEEHMNHSKLKRAQERDVEKLRRLNEMVYKARCVAQDNGVDDEMDDVIRDDLLQKQFNEHERMKDDKGNRIVKG
ncbi:hypothetical protein Tco_1349217, partial [Tanacetum coccineum]